MKHLAQLFTILCILLALPMQASAQGGANVTLYTTGDSLTIHVGGAHSVNLGGLGFEVLIRDARQTFFLEDFPSFAPVRVESTPAPICFRIERSGSSEPLPQACQDLNTPTLIQAVVSADIFWYDAASRQTRTIIIVQRPNQLDICPAGAAECGIRLPDTTPVPSPTLGASDRITRSTVPLYGLDFAYPVLENREWDVVSDLFDGYEMVLVPTGCFLMGDETGSLDERPVHQQCIERPFWIDRYEVSNALFGSVGQFTDPSLPRDSLTWYEAVGYCEDRDARLPTEREWEYAARGPDAPVYPWGDAMIPDNITFFENGDQRPAAVDSRPGSQTWVGAYNMTGNVWEWTSSIYTRSYPYESRTAENPRDTAQMRVLRGGSWRYEALRVRSAYRGALTPAQTADDVGVRCVRDFSMADLDP